MLAERRVDIDCISKLRYSVLTIIFTILNRFFASKFFPLLRSDLADNQHLDWLKINEARLIYLH